MKTLFEPVKISQLQLKNRAIRSATFEYSGSNQGRLTPEITDIYEKLAQGGVGTIITGMVGVNNKGRLLPIMIKADDKAFVQDYKPLSDLLHHQYDCKIVAQIAHCGVNAACANPSDPPVGPSSKELRSGVKAKALEKEEIQEIIQDFARAAVACKQAGIDGVQIHGAHGYLLSQFLSPVFNQRDDAYGGSIENRARMVFEVYQAVRNAVGDDYPVWIKINGEDLTEEGLTSKECLWVCQQLDALGLDAIEISGGIGVSRASAPAQRVKTEEDEGLFVDNAVRIAQAVNTPIICVGGFRTPKRIEQALNKGNIAAISLCRSLISEPDLIKRWQNGQLEKSRCISCNKCFVPKNGFGCQSFESV